MGFEAESKNRGRAEKSRLKKEGKEYKPEKRRKLKTGEVEIMKGKGNRQKWFYLKNQNDVKQLIRLGRNSAFPTGITKNNSRVKFDKNLHIKESVKGASIFEAKFTDDTLAPRIKHWASKHKGTGIGYGHVLGQLAIHMKEMGWNKSYKEVARIAMELGRKKKVESVNEEITDWQGGYNNEFKFKKGQLIRDINPDCPHHGSEGEVTKVTKDEVTYTVRNNGKNYKIGDELTKTKDQLTPLSINESKIKYYKTISKKEWSKTPKSYKSVIDGVKFKLFLDRQKGTILAPVKVESVNETPNFGRGTSGLPKGFTDDYYKIVKKLSKGKGYLTLSKSDKKKVWTTLGKIYTESVK